MIAYENTPETDLQIDLADGMKIHGYLRGPLDGSAVVVMMHGRGGWPDELLQYLGARYFHAAGLTALRLAMYDCGQKYRNRADCTLDTHAADFETVVDYLRRQNVSQIFAVGHSYGGLTIVKSKAVLDAAVFWDPSHGLAEHDPVFAVPQSEKYGDIIVNRDGPGFVNFAGPEAYDQALGDTTDWIRGKKYPMKFILAGAGPLAKYGRRYYDAAEGPKAVVEIPAAHHQFTDSDDVTEQLFAESSEWFQRYQKDV